MSGHKTRSVFDRYNVVSDGDLRDTARRLGHTGGHCDMSTARAFACFGLVCVAVAGVWGAVTVKRTILYIQALPAVVALALLLLT